MKFNFKKIASALTSTVLVGSTVALAAAASYPAPFVENGAADVAVVYGSDMDMAAVTDITTSLSSALGPTGTTGTPSGEYVQLDKSANRINLGNALNGPFGSTVDDEDLPTLLADGTYTADDSDTFDYEQKINLGSATMTHFRDSEFENLVGYTERTPTVGFKISSSTYIMNYTLDFLDNVLSDVVSGDLDDIEGSDLPLFGKNYYVTDFKNGTAVGNLGKLTLLDSAQTTLIDEGESVTLDVGGTSYVISAQIYSSSEVVFTINGETTNTLNEGETYNVNGDYLGVRDILYISKDSGTSSVDFSLGSGKIELEHKTDVKINGDSVTGLKAYLYSGSSSGASTVFDKLALEWTTDDVSFLASGSELTLPGFETINFRMNELVRSEEEMVTLENDGDTSIELNMPIKDGDASLNLLYANSTGEFSGLGKASDNRLATSHNGTLWFFDKRGGSNFHTKFVVSYNSSSDAQSYILDMNVALDTGDNRNETTIKNTVTGETWSERVVGDTFDIGDVSFSINTLGANSTDQWAVISAGSNVVFNTIYTPGGLRVYLPYELTNETIGYGGDNTTASAASANEANFGSINLSSTSGATEIHESTTAGHSKASWYLFLDGEDKDDTLAGGVAFNMTVDDTSTGELQVSQVNNAGTGGPTGLEIGDSSNTYEAYIVDDVAPRTLHYTDGSQDYARAYYPSGDSETYAEVFLTDVSASSGETTNLGSVTVMDSELESSGFQNRNLLVVGGSCINSVAAALLGSDTPMCGDSWTDATNAGSGQYIVQTFNNPNAPAKVATLVAGWAAGDTQNAATFLKTQPADITVGTKYLDGLMV